MKRGGHINQISSGRWRLRMSVAGKSETIGYFDTLEEAERKRDAAIETKRSVKGDYEGRTVAKFGREVLTRREVSKRIRDPQADWSRFEHHIEHDPIGKFALTRLAARPELVSRWLARLEQKGLAVQTRRNCRNVLSVIMQEAVELGYCKDNPVRRVSVRGQSAEGWTYASMVEQGDMLKAARGISRHILGVAMGGGLRVGELVTLRLADVILDAKPRIIVRYGKAPDRPTKTRKARAVPLFGIALAAVRSWLAILPDYAPNNPHGLLFPREGGGFRDDSHVLLWREWRQLLADAGITRRFRWHDLRHTCASSLVSGWWGRAWSLPEVKEMLGHTSIMVTQRYAHLAPDALGLAASGTSGVSDHVSGFLDEDVMGWLPPSPKVLENGLSGASGKTAQTNESAKRWFPQDSAANPSTDTLLTAKPPFPLAEATANLAMLRLAAIEGGA